MIDAQGIDAKLSVLGEEYYLIDCDYLLSATCSIQTTRKGRRRTF